MQQPCIAPPAESASRQTDFGEGFAIAVPIPAAPGIEGTETAGKTYADAAAREEAGLLERLRALDEPPRALTQVGECYILADAGAAGMLIIDQHAAHEKILYLRFIRQLAAGGPLEVQALMVPHSVEVSPAEAAALEQLIPALKQTGFDVEPFGGGTFIIQSVPAAFDRLDAPTFLRDLIDDVGQGNLHGEIERIRERIAARAACRAAVMSGDRLAPPEMQRLVNELLQPGDALRCPHGRPTVLLLTREQIDRQFGR